MKKDKEPNEKRKKQVKKSVAVIKTYKKNKCFFLDKKKGKESKRNQI